MRLECAITIGGEDVLGGLFENGVMVWSCLFAGLILEGRMSLAVELTDRFTA